MCSIHFKSLSIKIPRGLSPHQPTRRSGGHLQPSIKKT